MKVNRHTMFVSNKPSRVLGIRVRLAKGLQAATGCNVHHTPQGEAVAQQTTY